MKIESIDRANTNEQWTAFGTDTQITPEVWKIFLEFYNARPDVRHIRIMYQNGLINLECVEDTPLCPDFA